MSIVRLCRTGLLRHGSRDVGAKITNSIIRHRVERESSAILCARKVVHTQMTDRLWSSEAITGSLLDEFEQR